MQRASVVKEGDVTMEAETAQVFVVTVKWSAESEIRLTEGDIREMVEQMATELDEEATVDVAEGMPQEW